MEKHKPYQIPIAHGEGRFFADTDTLKRINDQDLVMFRYCNEEGQIIDETNCNGSLENIAGVSNEGRNVFGMMPHPERAADTDLGNTDGKLIFESLLEVVNA